MLSVAEALARGQDMTTRWCLLAYVVHNRKACPIFSCGACQRQQYTIVSRKRLPDTCPQCKKPQKQPLEAY